MKSRYTLIIVHFMMVFLMAMPINTIHGAFHETYELAHAPTTPEQDAEIRARKILIAGGLLAIGAAIGATAAVLCRPGRKGESGYSGLNGVPGKNGANGGNGLDGFNGPAGPIGPKGTTGPAIPFATDLNNSLTYVFSGLDIDFPNVLASYLLIPYVEMPNGSYVLGSSVPITGGTPFSQSLGSVTVSPPLPYGSYHTGVFVSPDSGSLTAADNNSTLIYGVVVNDTRSSGLTDLGQVEYFFNAANVSGGVVNNAEADALVYTYEVNPLLP